MNHSDAGKKGYEKTKHLLDAHRAKQRSTAQMRYEADPKICPNCGTVLPYEKRYNKFCNRSCSASYNNLGVTRHAKKPAECAHCGTIKEKRHNKYCDTCIENRVYNPTLELHELKNAHSIRNYLHRTRDHLCEVCKHTEWMGEPITLEVHHVDGDPDRNTEENLQLICPNCHSQTKTYKAKAIKNGTKGKYSRRRVMRRKRFRDGKSY